LSEVDKNTVLSMRQEDLHQPSKSRLHELVGSNYHRQTAERRKESEDAPQRLNNTWGRHRFVNPFQSLYQCHVKHLEQNYVPPKSKQQTVVRRSQ
jgi:hypothetical protein